MISRGELQIPLQMNCIMVRLSWGPEGEEVVEGDWERQRERDEVEEEAEGDEAVWKESVEDTNAAFVFIAGYFFQC